MIVQSEKVFQGKIISVYRDKVRLPDGRTVLWDRVDHPGAVGIVPLLEDKSVIMVRQYRNTVDGEILEIPAGKLDMNESPEACAIRELAEETGMKPGELIKIAEFYNSPGYSNEKFYLFLARGLEPEKGMSEDDEFLKIETHYLDALVKMIFSGELSDAKSIIGITLTKLILSANE